MTLDALLANLGELVRLKDDILSYRKQTEILPSSSLKSDKGSNINSPPSYPSSSTGAAIPNRDFDSGHSSSSSSSSFSFSSSSLTQPSIAHLNQHKQKYFPETKKTKLQVESSLSERKKFVKSQRENNHMTRLSVPLFIPLSASKLANDYQNEETVNVRIVPDVDKISVETFRYQLCLCSFTEILRSSTYVLLRESNLLY